MTYINNSKKGFTLIELLIAVALVAILASIGVPSVLNLISRIKLTRATRDISVALQAARLKAIAKNRQHKVYFVMGATDSYVLMTCTAGGACPKGTLGVGGGWVADPNSEYGVTKVLDPNLNISPPGVTFQVIFFPAGTATNNDDTIADQQICVTNTGNLGGAMQIRIRAATGKVSVDTGC